MSGKLRDKLTTRRTLVVVVGVMLALAWAVPSVGAGVGKVARLALGRANQAVYNSKLAIDASGKAKSTANSASASAGAASNTANAARSTANAAQSTANQALSVANGSAHVADNFTSGFDPPSVAAGECHDSAVTRLGVLSTDEVIVTPPSGQPANTISQALTSSGAITLRICNFGSSAADPPSGYEFSILR